MEIARENRLLLSLDQLGVVYSPLEILQPTQTLTLLLFEYRHVISARVFLVPVVAVSLSGICSHGVSNRAR